MLENSDLEDFLPSDDDLGPPFTLPEIVSTSSDENDEDYRYNGISTFGEQYISNINETMEENSTRRGRGNRTRRGSNRVRAGRSRRGRAGRGSGRNNQIINSPNVQEDDRSMENS